MITIGKYITGLRAISSYRFIDTRTRKNDAR